MQNIRRALLFAFGLASGAAVILFILRNRSPVEIHYLLGQTGPVPVWAVALTAFVVGASLLVILHLLGGVEIFLDRRRLAGRIAELEQELVELRNLPLAEAEIDISRPRPQVRPLANEPRVLVPEVMMPDDVISEGDLYPAITDKREEES